MEPPPCIQNAMLTKDKKPFTYTPGGLNLSEIRSPRMARRIERNAAYEGVGTPPPQASNRPQFDAASLPPSTLAAMQPQMHVQVFPSGPPPPPPMNHMRGGCAPPPPPPPPSGVIPPPPPAPVLPTQKFRTADQQVVERPDMTKIIPENPMALLKKTGGPRVKNTLLDEVYQNQPQPQAVPPSYSQVIRSPPPPMSPQNQQQWSPKIVERPEPPKLENQLKAVNVGTIYIPPLNKFEQNRNVATPPTPQSPKVQSPCTPTLKEAPKPWQQKKNQPEEVPEWAKRDANATPSPKVQEPQQTPVDQFQRPRWPQSNQQSPMVEQNQQFYGEQQPYKAPQQQPRIQQQQAYQPPQQTYQPQQQSYQPQPQPYREPNQQPYKVQQQQSFREAPQSPYKVQQQQSFREPQQPYKIQQQHIYLDQQPDPENHPNAVFVTQPIILKHPGSGYGPPLVNRRENVTVSKQHGNSRIIPVQVEGMEQPSPNRTFNQQPNWNNSFKKMQLNDTDQDSLRFKQVPNDPGQNRPQVRNIPIQIEGGSAPPAAAYIPPSQQPPAEEPKKYTGSSIPSRSFKILQAMTAHDSCANAKDANENYDPSYRQQGAEWVYPHPYHYYPPYWPPFYPPPHEQYSSESGLPPNENEVKTHHDAPPFYYWPSYYPPFSHCESDPELTNKGAKTLETFSRCSSASELENIDWRKTPVPFWNYPVYSHSKSPENTPFYMPYYYGYPPFYPPYSYEDVNGYSSTDEMSYYAQKSTNKQQIPTPEIIVTPTPASQVSDKEHTSSESDTDTEIDETKRCSSSGGLQTIKSVTNIQIYEESEEDEDSDDDSSDTSVDLEDSEDIVPHQLSVIFEVSERTEISRNLRENSVTSECTTVDDENDEKNFWNSDNLEEIASRIQGQIDARIELDRRIEEANCSKLEDVEAYVFPNYRSRFEDDDLKKTQVERLDEEKENLEKNYSKQRSEENTESLQAKIQEKQNESMNKTTREEIARRLQEMVEKQQREFTFNIPKEDTRKIEENIQQENIFSSKETTIEEEFSSNQITKEEYQNNLKLEDKSLKKTTIDKDVEAREQTMKEDNSDIKNEEVAKENVEHELETNSKESSDSEDWWGVIGRQEEDFPPRKPLLTNKEEKVDIEVPIEDQQCVQPINDSETITIEKETNEEETQIELPSIKDRIKALQEDILSRKIKLGHEKAMNDSIRSQIINVKTKEETKLEQFSTHSNNSSASSRKVSNVDSAPEQESSSEDSNSSDEEEDAKHDMNNNENKPPTIKERIEALNKNVEVKRKNYREEELKTSAKSSVKSFDEISEEDSGVTDMSRHYSDNEEFPELRKMSKYQRAATHSRLFQLLQEECENEDDEIEINDRKNQLTLPLISDKLADELVNSMLKQKKGQIFRNMSMDKLHAAARKILQEENAENLDTPSEGFSEFCSPNSEFSGVHNEYARYYESWSNPSEISVKKQFLARCPMKNDVESSPYPAKS